MKTNIKVYVMRSCHRVIISRPNPMKDPPFINIHILSPMITQLEGLDNDKKIYNIYLMKSVLII